MINAVQKSTQIYFSWDVSCVTWRDRVLLVCLYPPRMWCHWARWLSSSPPLDMRTRGTGYVSTWETASTGTPVHSDGAAADKISASRSRNNTVTLRYQSSQTPAAWQVRSGWQIWSHVKACNGDTVRISRRNFNYSQHISYSYEVN
jgi:hypothetical protein